MQCKDEYTIDDPLHALFYCKENKDETNFLYESGISNKYDLKRIVSDSEMIEVFKNVCESIIDKRNKLAD